LNSYKPLFCRYKKFCSFQNLSRNFAIRPLRKEVMFYGMLYKLLIIMFLHSKATSNLHSFDPPSQYPRYCCELSLAQLVRFLAVESATRVRVLDLVLVFAFSWIISGFNRRYFSVVEYAMDFSRFILRFKWRYSFSGRICHGKQIGTTWLCGIVEFQIVNLQNLQNLVLVFGYTLIVKREKIDPNLTLPSGL